MKIAISGLHSQGKTTLVQALKKNISFFSNYIVLDSICRELSRQGFEINENCNDEVQYRIASLHIERFNKGDNLIIERCPLDTVAYAKYLLDKQKISEETFQKCVKIHQIYSPKYDYIFYINPELPLEKDKQKGRSENLEFFEKTRENFTQLIKEYKHCNLKILFGSLEKRIAQIKYYLKNEKNLDL